MTLAALLLGACATTSPSTPSTTANRTGPLARAQAAFQAGRVAEATQTLDSVQTASLSPTQRAQFQLLRGRIAASRGQPRAVLDALPAGVGTPATAPAVLKLRAEALFQLHRPVAGTAALVARTPLLASDQARRANVDLIWQKLTAAPLTASELDAATRAGETTRGWIALAELAQHGATLRQYTAWQAQYPHHPASAHLAQLLLHAHAAQPVPAAIQIPPVGPGPAALLLPLNGPLGKVGKVVRAGFEAGLTQAGAAAPLVYNLDAGGAPTTQAVAQAVSQAVAAGAGMLVGPLSKLAVATTNALGAQGVPVLVLNYLAPGVPPSAGLLQFGLSPADQARQAASDAVQRGLHRAVALVPDSPRGTATLNALQQRLTALGGSVAASLQYTPGSANFSDLVRQLLGINASVQRDKAVANALGQRPKFQPRRRQDVDFIFISGTQTNDRMMAAMFRFWRANTLPIYSIADVNSGSGNPDLAGVRFCTAPWKLSSGPAWDAVRAQLLAGAGNNPQLEPFYALGLDAARLSLALRSGALRPTDQLAGYTGELSIGASGVIHRALSCAQVTLGGPQPLPGPTLPPPSRDIVDSISPLSGSSLQPASASSAATAPGAATLVPTAAPTPMLTTAPGTAIANPGTPSGASPSAFSVPPAQTMQAVSPSPPLPAPTPGTAPDTQVPSPPGPVAPPSPPLP
ncbi:MAG TPA: penicillin-binding protein activator [Nevskiaceae bacterium]|nr:penicillin-binding protein activator [Nevskiaceae bacterium]